MSCSRLMLCPLLCASLAVPVGAATTGELCGWVVDEAGLTMAEVAVAASSPAQIGGEQTTRTNKGGYFQFPRLAAGEYRVVVAREGFVTHEVVDVPVRLDRRTEIRVTLSIAAFGGQVTVTDETPVVDPTRVSMGQNFTADYLERSSVGSFNRYFWNAVVQAPGANQIPGRSYPETSVAGSAPEENTYLIDGLDTTDIFNGGPGAYLNFEAIDEISLQTAGFEAEYGRATGGVVNLVTKSGGNELELTLDSRYRDESFDTGGRFYDPDRQPSSYWQTSAAVGGPIARDKLWYFGSVLFEDLETTPYRAAATTQLRVDNLLAKVTWKPSPSWLLIGKYSGGDLRIDNASSGQFESAEAATYVEQLDDIFQVEASGVLGSNLLFSGQIGRNARIDNGLPQHGDLSSPSHWNTVNFHRTGNIVWQWLDDMTRDVLRTDLAYLAEDLAGTHEFKAGVEHHDLRFATLECPTGDPLGRGCSRGTRGHQFFDGVDSLGRDSPLAMEVNTSIGEIENAGEVWSAFAQDAWRPRADVTLQLGLRWDGVSYENSYGNEVADLTKLQPRVGVAWDVGASGKRLLRGSWGHFMDIGTIRLPYWVSEPIPRELWWSCSANLPLFGYDPSACAVVAASLGWSWGEDPWSWDPAGWLLDPANVVGSSGSEVANGLKPSYTEQLVLGFEQEIAPRSSLELGFLRKETRNGIDDTCIGNLPVPMEGASCDSLVVTNLPQIRREYEAWILRAESRFFEGVHLVGSYVYSKSKGSVWSTSTHREETFDIYPYHFVNRYGYLPDHRRHRLKLNGYVRLPLDFELGFSGWWSSPSRWTPTDHGVTTWGGQLVEPRGSRKLEDSHQLDLQLSKGFEIGRTRLELIGAVYNLLDSEQPITVCDGVAGCGEIALGEAASWQQPRRYEVGLRIER